MTAAKDAWNRPPIAGWTWAQLSGGRSGSDRALFLAAAGMAALSFSNPAWQTLHALAWIILGVRMFREHRWLVPGPRRWAIPWGLFAAWVTLSVALGAEPEVALRDTKKLLNLLAIFLFAAVLRMARDYLRVVVATCAILSVQSVIGLVQYLNTADPVGYRSHGTLSHHMTYSGMLLIVISMVLGLLTFRRSRADLLLWSFAGLATAALLATLTRSAWIGLAVALTVILTFKNPRWLAALPVALALLFLVAPQLRERTISIFDTQSDDSNVQRLSMVPVALRMIADRPLLGQGGRRAVRDRYTEYEGAPARPPRDDPDRPQRDPYEPPDHLHNNIMQIAAANGLPALLAWLAALAIYLRELLQTLPRRRDVHDEDERLRRNLLLGSLAGVAAFLTMGMLEYNFGDSEVSVLLFFALSFPFALRRRSQA